MNILKRTQNLLKNLWRLGELEQNPKGIVTPFIDKIAEEELSKPRMTQFIKRTTPVEDFMKKANE